MQNNPNFKNGDKLTVLFDGSGLTKGQTFTFERFSGNPGKLVLQGKGLRYGNDQFALAAAEAEAPKTEKALFTKGDRLVLTQEVRGRLAGTEVTYQKRGEAAGQIYVSKFSTSIPASAVKLMAAAVQQDAVKQDPKPVLTPRLQKVLAQVEALLASGATDVSVEFGKNAFGESLFTVTGSKSVEV